MKKAIKKTAARKPASKAAVRKPVKAAVKKAPASGTIAVKLASLTKPIEIKNIKNGTTIGQFLTDNGLTFNASIRVNSATVGQDYKLKKGDIVCVVTQVSGGRN